MLLVHRVKLLPTEAIRPLVIRQVPVEGESLLGLLSRSLAKTSLRSTSRGLTLAGIGIHRPQYLPRTLTDRQQIQNLAKLLGTAENEITDRLHVEAGQNQSDRMNFNGVPLRWVYFRSQTRRIAPSSLSVVPVHKAIWEIGALSFDPDSLETLLGVCPVCNQSLSWNGVCEPYQCDHCRDADFGPTVDLRDFPQPRVETEDPQALTLIPRLLHCRRDIREEALRSIAPQFSNLDASQVLEFVLSLATALALNSMSTKVRARGGRPADLVVDHTILERVGRVALEAGGLHSLLEQVRDCSINGGRHLNFTQYFDGIGNLMYSGFIETSAKQSLHAAMADVLKERPVEPDKPELKDHLDFKALAKVTGVSLQRLTKMADGELIKVQLGGHRRRTRYAQPSDVLAVSDRIGDAIAPRQVEEILGVERANFGFLEEVGLLVRCDPRLQPLLPCSRSYSMTAARTVVAQLNRPVCIGATPPIKLTEALEQTSFRPYPWGAVFAVLATRQGYGVAAPKSDFSWKRDILVPALDRFQTEVREIQNQFASADSMSGREAASLLRMSTNQFYGIAKSNILIPTADTDRYSRASIEAFQAEYLYGTRLARRCNRRGMNGSIAPLLSYFGVEEAFPNAPLKIYRKSEIEAVLRPPRHSLQ